MNYVNFLVILPDVVYSVEMPDIAKPGVMDQAYQDISADWKRLYDNMPIKAV
jgi:hypothetical protein